MRLLVVSLISLLTATAFGQYNLTIEQSTPAAASGTVYRFYVEANDPSDKMSAVFGNDQFPLVFSTSAEASSIAHPKASGRLCVMSRIQTKSPA